ncbi:hypothetical protein [Streptomyces sp. NPDC056491]|uniref:hypothetical protein n=1 Tax=Streptomyces sp. NPDC056491 TaxID=3345837 RepID=UPI0036C15DBE
MADDSTPHAPGKVADRDLARLMKRGTDELANDPTAAKIYERIQDRENLEEDRDHRERSDRSAAIGFLAGLLILVIVIVVSVATSQP